MVNLKHVKLRIILSGFIFLILFCIISVKLIFLTQNSNNKIKIVANSKKIITHKRGEIFDRNNFILATTIPTQDLILNPSVISNKQFVSYKLNEIFNQISIMELTKKLSTNSRYYLVKKNISNSDAKKVLELGIPDTQIKKSYIRKYPGQNLASHIIGNVNTEHVGISGIELSQEKLLSQGNNIKLSIDIGIQNILTNLIKDQIKKFDAEGGAGVLMDVNSGQIHAITSLPDYNNNFISNLSKKQLFNKATKGIYELGSTLKIFTAAIALESGVVKESDLFDVSKPIRISSYEINDFSPLNFSINIPEVLVHSSNIGSAKIASKIGYEIQHKYLNKLGFDKKINFELVELGKPKIVKDQKLISTMTISYGHGIQITPLHLTKGTAIILNGGNLIQPTILNNNNNNNNIKIFSNETSLKMRSILRLVVKNKKYGTGKKAEALGYSIGGKTGTANKVKENGKYSKKEKIVTFTGGFPMNNPKYAFTIMIDNPKGQKFSYNYATAGWVVAPVVKKLINRIAPILKIHPLTKQEENQLKGLKKYKIRGSEL